MQSLTTAYLLGARVLEKHFTLNKKQKGNDHYHSMNLKDLQNFKKHIEMISISIGKSKLKKPIKTEFISRKNARRSIVVLKKIKKNEKLSDLNLISKRPGTGISPMFWKKIIGKKAIKNLTSDYILKWRDFK